MTRIISGSAKGRTLRVPPAGTRPTSDRVREAIFSSLEHRLGSWQGLAVYDLYAGSGAFALEALSRGAASAVAVEKDRKALDVIRANASTVGVRLDVVASEVGKFVTRQPAPVPDVVFVDPPYEVPADVVRAELAALLAQIPDHEVLLVIERAARDTASPVPDGCDGFDRRTIGETSVTYARWYGYAHE